MGPRRGDAFRPTDRPLPSQPLTAHRPLPQPKPDTRKPAHLLAETPEEVEKIRVDFERRRSARLLWKGGATDTHDYAPA
jgi:hypothetical protein